MSKNVFLTVQQSYDDVSIVSSWSSEEQAEEVATLLNAGRFPMETPYETLIISLDTPMQEFREILGVKEGFSAQYDTKANGLNIDASKVVFAEALYRPNLFGQPRVPKITEEGIIQVHGATHEECVENLQKIASQLP